MLFKKPGDLPKLGKLHTYITHLRHNSSYCTTAEAWTDWAQTWEPGSTSHQSQQLWTRTVPCRLDIHCFQMESSMEWWPRNQPCIQGTHSWGVTGWQQPCSLILLYSHSPPCQTQSTLGSSCFKDKIQSTRLHIGRGERTTAVHRPSGSALPSYHSGSTAWKSENKQQEN